MERRGENKKERKRKGVKGGERAVKRKRGEGGRKKEEGVGGRERLGGRRESGVGG